MGTFTLDTQTLIIIAVIVIIIIAALLLILKKKRSAASKPKVNDENIDEILLSLRNELRQQHKQMTELFRHFDYFLDKLYKKRAQDKINNYEKL